MSHIVVDPFDIHVFQKTIEHYLIVVDYNYVAVTLFLKQLKKNFIDKRNHYIDRIIELILPQYHHEFMCIFDDRQNEINHIEWPIRNLICHVEHLSARNNKPLKRKKLIRPIQTLVLDISRLPKEYYDNLMFLSDIIDLNYVEHICYDEQKARKIQTDNQKFNIKKIIQLARLNRQKNNSKSVNTIKNKIGIYCT